MYYEEKIINGKLMFRNKPDGPWQEKRGEAGLAVYMLCKLSSEDRERVFIAFAEIGAIQQKLWNQAATWPDDFDDEKQNPHGRPIDYWCPTVGGQLVGWEGVSGFATKEKALEIAEKFRNKCISWLSEHKEIGPST